MPGSWLVHLPTFRARASRHDVGSLAVVTHQFAIGVGSERGTATTRAFQALRVHILSHLTHLTGHKMPAIRYGYSEPPEAPGKLRRGHRTW